MQAMCFIDVCFFVYGNADLCGAYLHETMMSPDSCGYLREALNLAQGNGFQL